MNESFVNAGSLLKSDQQSDNHSIFEDIIPANKPENFDFLEMKTISKLIKYTSCFYDKLKGYMNTQNYKVGLQISEEGETDYMIEDAKLIKILLEILADLNLTNLLSLIFTKFKIKYPIEKSLISNVKEYSQVYNFKLDFNVNSIYNNQRMRSNLNQRRISGLVINSIFKKLSVGAV